jgi:hypothetical protein
MIRFRPDLWLDVEMPSWQLFARALRGPGPTSSSLQNERLLSWLNESTVWHALVMTACRKDDAA